MKRYFCVLIVLIGFHAFAQINFEPGYFISNNGVKTACLIRNSDWRNNPVEIEYKVLSDTKILKAEIAQITEFNITNSYRYLRFTVNVDRSTSDINNLSNDRNPVFKQETVFLKLLVAGDANLYMYENANITRYFISTGDHKTAEQLVYKEFISDGNYANQNNYFRQQLLNTLKSDKMSISDFQNLAYRKEALTSVFVKYNNSTQTVVTNYEEKQNHGSFNLKPVIGVASGSLSVGVERPKDYVFETKQNFAFGLEAEYILPFNRNKWSLFVAPTYQNYKSKSVYLRIPLEAEYKFIAVPIGFRHYLFLTANTKLFIDAGYALSFNFDSKVSVNGYDIEVTRNSNVFAGAGIAYKELAFEFRYDFKHGILSSSYYGSSFSTATVLVTYKIL